MTVVRDEPIRRLDRVMQSRKPANERQGDEDRYNAGDPKGRVATVVPAAVVVADMERSDQLAPARIAR